MIQAIIFDCFGVLVGKGFEHTYRQAGGDPVQDREFIADLLGRANLGLIDDAEFRGTLIKHLGITLDDWRDAILVAEQPDAVLLDYIKNLRQHYKTAILSNANIGTLDRRIGPELLTACFDELIVSADVGMVKPNPRIYQHAAEKLGVEPAACIFIDDNAFFLTAAQELGMKTVLCTSTEQSIADINELLA